jgi:hypothetical protein
VTLTRRGRWIVGLLAVALVLLTFGVAPDWPYVAP